MNDWNFFVREVGRGRGVQERSLEKMAELVFVTAYNTHICVDKKLKERQTFKKPNDQTRWSKEIVIVFARRPYVGYFACFA